MMLTKKFYDTVNLVMCFFSIFRKCDCLSNNRSFNNFGSLIMDLETEIGNFDYNLRNYNTGDDDDEAFNLIPPGTPEFKRLSCGMSFSNTPNQAESTVFYLSYSNVAKVHEERKYLTKG